LKKGGRYITVGGILHRLLGVFLASKLSNKNLHILALKANKDLKKINHWYEQGKIKAVIDGPYPFEDLPRLVRYFGEGRHQGKVVISV
jgi:NADPH:quinone reductase-like Zn-dependent oxidoreductase